jgi:hypothetical protein
MRLILGDMHLLNEANDRYNKVIPNIQEGLKKLDLLDKIDAVDIIGDILDCEYVTYKRITYFSSIMDLISELFSDNIRVLIGNHDKFFKNDQHDENIIRYIRFDGEIIDSPTIIDRILYIPHYYNKDNFPAGLLEEKDFDIIFAHLGIQFVNGIEELTIENVRALFKKKPIISGHIHNIDLDYANNNFFLGSLKSESWKEQAPVYAVAIVDKADPSFVIFPYHKIHLMVVVHDEDQFRKQLLEIFKNIHKANKFYIYYNKDGDEVSREPCDKYITSMINIKLKIFDKDIKKKDIDVIVDFCKHEIDDPTFVNLPVKIIYQIENQDSTIVDSKGLDKFKVDKQLYADQKKTVFDFIDSIRQGQKLVNLGKNKKFTKVVETIGEDEIERFAEFLLVSEKAKQFEELIRMIT